MLKSQGGGGLKEPYKIIPTDLMVRNIFNFYVGKFGQDVKFDLWIPELSLSTIWSRKYNSFYTMLPYINKIYVLSDGNSQSYSFAQAYVQRIKDNPLTNEKMIEEINLLQNKDDTSLENQKKKIYKKSTLYDYLRYDKFFTIFHIARYTDSPIYDIRDDLMYKAYRFNFDYFDMSNKLYADSNAQTQKQYFISFYEQFFKIKDKNLESFVYKGFEHYDPKKKNIIWMGDSLIREKKHINKKRTEEIQKTFLALTLKYDPQNYNYFFKHHPFYSSEQQSKLTNFIAPSLEKPIYFTNFPWELFLSWDKANASTNSNYVSFFGVDKNNDSIAQTSLVGIQYTSTTILSTYSFVKNQYNLNEDNVFKSIDYTNFPVPGTFDIIKRGEPSKIKFKKQVEINKQKTDEIYQPFLAMGLFTKYKQNQKTTVDLLNSLDINYSFNIDDLNDPQSLYQTYALYIMITIVSLVIIIQIILFSLLKTKKDSKNIEDSKKAILKFLDKNNKKRT